MFSYSLSKFGYTLRLITKTILVLATWLSAASATAQGFDDIPGMVPRTLLRPPSTDLVYKGKIITSDQALKLYREKSQDLADLNPDETSDLWKNTSPEPLKATDSELGVDQIGETFDYVKPVASTLGNFFRFKVTKRGANGVLKDYTVMVSKRIHNVILRKNLMRKLGYYVQPMQQLKKFKLRFKGRATIKSFLGQPLKEGEEEGGDEEDDDDGPSIGRPGLIQGTNGDAARWVTNLDDEDTKILEMQDAIIVPGEVIVYNLATRPPLDIIIKGRRVLNALSVVYGMAEVPESVNLFSWRPARIVNNNVFIPFAGNDNFSTTNADARWMIRRLQKLKRQDFEEVVGLVGGESLIYPPAVAHLILEKLIARRNYFLELFKMPGEKIKYDAKVSYGDSLQEGKLVSDSWDGYGSRFAFGDKKSPINKEEIKSLLKSKLISGAISELERQFNEHIMPRSDVESAIREKQQDYAIGNFIRFLQTGKVQKAPVEFFAVPVFDTNVHVSRQIITGSYLGTDNVVQLADAVGFSVDGGLVVGAFGLNPAAFVNGSARANYNIMYTHLKPVQSIKAAMKEPYKNIMVPMLKNRIAHTLDDLVTGELDDLDPEERQIKINTVMGTFKDKLGVGESLIISEGLGGNVGLSVGYRWGILGDRVSAFAGFQAGLQTTSRLHILRRDKNTIHIYKDLGNFAQIQVTLVDVNAITEIVNVSLVYKKGVAKTKFMTLNIEHDEEKNPDLINSVTMLRSLLLTRDTEAIEAVYSPYVLRHNLSESQFNMNFLFWKRLKLKQKDRLKVTAPDGDQREYIRYYQGKRRGKGFQGISIDVINEALAEITGEDLSIPDVTSGNPGDTIKGKALARSVAFESELYEDENGELRFDEPFVDFHYYWKGWSIKRNKLEKIIHGIHDKYGFEFYNAEALGDSEKVHLYQLLLDIYIYAPGIEHMLSLTESQLISIFVKYGNFMSEAERDRVLTSGRLNSNAVGGRRVLRLVRQFMARRGQYFKKQDKGKLKKAAAKGAKMVSVLEGSLSVTGLIEAAGGKENIYITSQLQGFRVGSEDGDVPYMSNHLGEVGSDKWMGPLRTLQHNIGMTEGEFFVHWMLRRL